MPTGHPTYAELHLHLGGAVLPRILYTFLTRAKRNPAQPEMQEIATKYLRRWPTYEKFERRLMRKSNSLTEYLQAHKVVEPLQTIENIPYFINRLLRGAYVFEHLSYLELRYNPYFRLPPGTPESEVKETMAEVISTIALAAKAGSKQFPVVFTQILCMDGRLPKEVNRAIVELADEMKAEVAAIDLAGPDEAYRDNLEDLKELLEEAKEKRGLNVTCHLFETTEGCFPELLPYCDRIGHGIQIPLRYPRLLNQVVRRGQCLEICPTTYFRTGTISSYDELTPVFRQCFDMGADVTVCTDNSAFHEVRLPLEYERLLTHRVCSFEQLERCRENAFKHAFRWPGKIDQRNDALA